MPNPELSTPDYKPQDWIVWILRQPEIRTTVRARLWIEARELGRVTLQCDEVGVRRASVPIDACILCMMSPCICPKNKPEPEPEPEPHQELYNSFINTTDSVVKSICRDKILALIFKKMFDL
jgi:hypothetical protein